MIEQLVSEPFTQNIIAFSLGVIATGLISYYLLIKEMRALKSQEYSSVFLDKKAEQLMQLHIDLIRLSNRVKEYFGMMDSNEVYCKRYRIDEESTSKWELFGPLLVNRDLEELESSYHQFNDSFEAARMFLDNEDHIDKLEQIQRDGLMLLSHAMGFSTMYELSKNEVEMDISNDLYNDIEELFSDHIKELYSDLNDELPGIIDDNTTLLYQELHEPTFYFS